METFTIMLYSLIALYIAIYVLRTIYYTHIFQLNSYKPPVQIKWLLKNKVGFFKNSFLLIISVIVALFLKIDLVCCIIAIVAFVATIVLNIPKKAKKPLVYTNRVKRLLITNALLLIAEIMITLYLIPTLSLKIVGLAVFLIISPLTLLLCNYINKPLENSINRYYINDAKKIIKDHKSLVTIGVTGSYGKTSVKYILGTLLEAKYNVLITPESYNTTLGVTKVIRSSLRATHDIFVCEMGAKNIGDIKEICDIVHPKHGIITSIGPQHLESFKTLDNVKKTKFELADSLPATGKLFLNGVDGNTLSYEHEHPAISFGLSSDCDYYADRLTVTSSGTSFFMNHNGESVEFNVSLIGAHNVLNIVGALAVCCELGIELSKLPPYARKIKPVEHRLKLSKRVNLTVIDDAYNSNPSGAKAAVDTLSLFNMKKIIITPGMVELGSLQYEENYKFGENIAKVCDFVVLVGQKQTEPIYKGLIDAGYSESQIFVADNLTVAADKAFGLYPDEEKVVLFENDLPDNY